MWDAAKEEKENNNNITNNNNNNNYDEMSAWIEEDQNCLLIISAYYSFSRAKKPGLFFRSAGLKTVNVVNEACARSVNDVVVCDANPDSL